MVRFVKSIETPSPLQLWLITDRLRAVYSSLLGLDVGFDAVLTLCVCSKVRFG